MNNNFGNTFLFDDNDSDEELERINQIALLHVINCRQDEKKPHTGSVEGRITIERGVIEGHEKLYQDYFSRTPTYNENLFRRRFRMSRNLFLRIVDGVKANNSYFVRGRNAAGKLGLSSHQKVTAAMRLLAYGSSSDSLDEYLRCGATTSMKCLKQFCATIIEVYTLENKTKKN